ncbi:MAG TPA: OmpH family outer membrane protein [Kofleriaceae bacterium]|nr:OmpH family outer membrane protein [Kofleriaceae bacterium]
MKRTLAIIIMGFALIAWGWVRADAAAPAATKVGYVDLSEMLAKTPQGRKAKAQLDREKATRQKALDKKQDALEKFAASLDKQSAVLKPDVLRQREQELQQRVADLRTTYVKLQRELAEKEAKLLTQIFNKAGPVIKKVAKRDGYTMILDKNKSAVLWATDAVDITDQVIKGLK